MNQLIFSYEMETPKELTTEEVYEVALDWLRGQEVANDYNRNANRAMEHQTRVGRRIHKRCGRLG